MSARLEIESAVWNRESGSAGLAIKTASQLELESLLHNFDQKDLVAPLREVIAAQEQFAGAPQGSEKRRQAALALQAKWDELLVQRDLLRNEIKRGKEVLEQTQRELVMLRDRLENWPAFERVCGSNPLLDYMQAIANHEKLEQFLPGWLKRRESQLAALNHNVEETARQTGLEHLL